MPSFPKQIIGSFEDIGKDIAWEVAKVPTDIAGKALESLGTASAKAQGGQTAVQIQKQPEGETKAPDAWEHIDATKDSKLKQSIARSALEALSKRAGPKKLSVWEQIQKDDEDKKAAQNSRQAQQARNSIAPGSSKRKRGDLYGMKAKKASAEMSRNVRQD